MKLLTLLIAVLSISLVYGLNLYDKGCNDDTECPGVARCLPAGCLGTQCLCPETYMPNDEYTKCLKIIDLGAPCGDADSRCRLPNTRCASGKCECQAGFIPAVDNKRCKKRALAINSGWALLNESCSQEILCTDGHTMECDGVCKCTTNYREATPADLSAFPNSGECVSSSYKLGQDLNEYQKLCKIVPEGGLKEIGEICTTDNNCPGNSTCQQVGCDKKCFCEVNFAPSDDRKKCLKLTPFEKACNSETVCETLHSKCSNEENGGVCECDNGYENTGVSLCRKVSGFPGTVKYATINESCASGPVRIRCQTDLECTNDICQCDGTLFREASVLERIAFNPEGYCVPNVATLNPTEADKDSICFEVPTSQSTQTTTAIAPMMASSSPSTMSQPDIMATAAMSQPDIIATAAMSQPDIIATSAMSQPDVMETNTQESMSVSAMLQPANMDTSAMSQPDIMATPAISQPDNMDTSAILQPANMDTSVMSQPDIIATSAMSQLDIMDTSAMVQPDNMDTSAMSQPDNMDTSAMAQPESMDTSAMSQPDIMATPAMSQPDNMDTSAMVQPANMDTSAMSQPDIMATPAISQPDNMDTSAMVQPANLDTSAMSQPDIMATPAMSQPDNMDTSAISQPNIMATDTHISETVSETSQPAVMATSAMSQPDVMATEDVSQMESLYSSQATVQPDAASSVPTATFILQSSEKVTAVVEQSQDLRLVDSTAISIEHTSTVEPSSSMYNEVNQTQTEAVNTTTVATITTTVATVFVFDSCVNETECPANAECTKFSCSGSRCSCKPGYFPANKDTECLKGVKLDEGCNDTITCSVPFSVCKSGKCACGPALPRSTPDGFCTRDLPSVGESCIGNDLCHGMAHCNSATSKCECDEGFREANEAEVFSAGLVWYINGRCIKLVVNEVATECAKVEVGETCSSDFNCPDNSMCITALATGADNCNKRCWCDVGFAPSADKTSCLPVIKIGETCDRASNRCITPLSRCINNKCECYQGFLPAVNNTFCKPEDYPQYFITTPILGDDCDDRTNRCVMKGEQVCNAGKCECRPGLRPATYLDLVAQYYDMRQCRNASVEEGYRPPITCSDPPLPLVARPDFDLPDKPGADLKRNQLLLYVLVPLAVIAAVVMATIYTGVRRRRRLAQKNDDTCSSVDSDGDSTASFHLPRPRFNLSRFRSDQRWTEPSTKYNTPDPEVHRQ